jgi:hypothetical protein
MCNCLRMFTNPITNALNGFGEESLIHDAPSRSNAAPIVTEF